MWKRILLFLLTNIAIIAVLSITFSILSSVFGIQYASVFTGENFIPLLVFAAVIWFTGSFISLLLSKTMAKWSYKVKLISQADLYSLDKKQKLVYDVVERLSQQSNIKMPEVGIYQSSEPNAFATGATKNSSLVAV